MSPFVCVSPFISLYALSLPSLKVLLMQESVRRIIEAEESRMGEMSNILGMGLSWKNVF